MAEQRIYNVGDARVARVVDTTLDALTPQRLLRDLNSDDWDLMKQMTETMSSDGRHVLLSVHSWVVWHSGKLFIVDTGAGNDKQRPHAPYFDHLKTEYLSCLAALGVQPNDVDYVLHTHLHVDHVGWNTQLVDGQWRPTFAHARHIFSKKEYDYFTDNANLTDRNRTSFQVQADSVTPINKAGFADMIEITGAEIFPGFSFHPTPGHSIDHASIILESRGSKALFAGDVLHHPLQVIKPELMSMFDPDHERSLRSRLWALDYAADQNAIWFSSHFPSSSAGHVSRSAKGYSWCFS